MTATVLMADILAMRADLLLAAGALVLLVAGTFVRERALQRIAIGGVTILVLCLIAVSVEGNGAANAANGVRRLFGDMVVHDRFGVFLRYGWFSRRPLRRSSWPSRILAVT